LLIGQIYYGIIILVKKKDIFDRLEDYDSWLIEKFFSEGIYKKYLIISTILGALGGIYGGFNVGGVGGAIVGSFVGVLIGFFLLIILSFILYCILWFLPSGSFHN
jgi:hypothetical protein